MNLAEYDYQVWRKALHELQIKIDNFDNTFWDTVINNHLVDTPEFPKLESEWQIGRQKLVDELEAHHQSHPGYPS